MIIGIGTDICDTRRIARKLNAPGNKFASKVFTSDERDYCEAHPRPEERYAKRFAAKEAVAKALSTEESGWLNWQDVEVVRQASGRPDIKLHGKAAARLARLTPDGFTANIRLSLSDEPPYALAFVVIELLKDHRIIDRIGE